MIIAPPARLSTLTIRLWLTALLALLILLLAACNTLPTRPNAPVSYSVAAVDILLDLKDEDSYS